MADETLPEPGLPEPGLPVAKVDFLYRVYAVKPDMPPLEKLLARLTSGNPYNPPGSFIFPPGRGMRRLQDALGASKDYFVMGYLREEAADLFAGLEAAIAAGEGPGLEDHDRAIAREAKLCVVIRAEIENPENNEYVETLVHLADAFGDLLHGIVWDVYQGKVFGRVEWRERVMEEPASALNHVSIATAPGGEGRVFVRTRGLRKFGSPDLEAAEVPEDLVQDVGGVLRDFAEHLFQGELLAPDEVIEYTHGRIQVVETQAGELFRLADEDDPQRGAAGLPKVFEALRAARRAAEGQRASGGRGAQD
jgi:hypothetical protein